MNSKDISSTPNTIQNYNNYLKDYVNTSGFSWNSTCLDVAFKNLGNKFSDYVNKVGDFNTVTATNPIYTPPRSYQEKNYSGPCPEGWTINPIWGNYSSCTNQSYTGPCNAGQSIQTPIAASCPAKNVGNPTSYQNSYNYWSWNWWMGWRNGSYSTPNNNSYTGWYGPTDASQGDFANTNIGSQPPGAGSYCTAGWSAGNSQGGSQADCTSSGGTWVNYYNDPTFNSHGYTCYKPTQYNWTTKPPSYFYGYSNENKRNWENQCQAYWPMQTINIPGKWTCTYGTSILNDIAAGNLFQIRTSEPINSPSDAARIVLKNSINTNQMSNNYFFMVNNNIYITSPTSNIGIITSKGQYQPNCTQQNNQKGTLYYISEAFFDLVKKCATVNNAINQTNNNRDVLQASIDNSIKENFTTAEILQNQDEIIRNLANNYNKKAELYNYQIDVIGNNEKLVNTQNTKLNKQFNEMTEIQEQIALKSRVIELNDELVKKQLRNKKILIGFFVLLPFLGIPLLLMIIGAFSPIMGISLAGLLILGYVIYILVISNMSEIKKFGRENKQIMSKYENAISNYWNKEKELLSKSLSKFVYGKCADGSQQEEEESSGGGGRNIAYPKGDYIMKSNGPFYYYDGSAPPQQIYPGAIGSINFNIEGNTYKFPKEISAKFNEIKNPITKFFFQTWGAILVQNGISFDDPRFSQDLDVIDFTDTDQTPMPFWDNIKLPIVTNIEQQFNYLFQSYNKEKKTLSKTASVLLVDLWNFVFGDKIPGDVYETWVKKLADVVKQTNPNIEQFYQDYLQSIMSLPKFTEKYGTINKFVELKMVDFIKTFNQDIHVSSPFAKKMVA
jgi:hypothetical protein